MTSLDPILVVTANDKNSEKIAAAHQALGLPIPIRLTTGSEAITWLRKEKVAACIVDYELPDRDGIDVLLHFKQQQPQIPVVMISDAHSESIALAAFEMGVVDYIPTKRHFADVVARHVANIVRQESDHLKTVSPLEVQDIPVQLLRPNYENRLRIVGYHIDRLQYRNLSLLEIESGFLLRGLSPGQSRHPEAMDVANGDFEAMVRDCFLLRGHKPLVVSTSTLLTTGYEDFLRAIGHAFDMEHKSAVSITELENFLAVSGVDEGDEQRLPFQTLLRLPQIEALLNDGFGRRST